MFIIRLIYRIYYLVRKAKGCDLKVDRINSLMERENKVIGYLDTYEDFIKNSESLSYEEQILLNDIKVAKTRHRFANVEI